MGATLAQIRDGLIDCRPTEDRSPGRLNLYRLGGRLVAPVGPEGRQELLRFTRHKDQFLRERLGEQPGSVVDGVKRAAGMAGATVTGEVALQPKFNDLSGANQSSLSSINTSISSADGLGLAAGSDPQTAYQQQAAQLIATAILDKTLGQGGQAGQGAQPGQTMLPAASAQTPDPALMARIKEIGDGSRRLKKLYGEDRRVSEVRKEALEGKW